MGCCDITFDIGGVDGAVTLNNVAIVYGTKFHDERYNQYVIRNAEGNEVTYDTGINIVESEIIIKNETGTELTIVRLDDMCGNNAVDFKKQQVLKANEEIFFKDLKPVMHHYEICANGTCEISSIGMDTETKTYMIQVVINGIYVWGIVTPKIWPGNNKCEDEIRNNNKLWAINSN